VPGRDRRRWQPQWLCGHAPDPPDVHLRGGDRHRRLVRARPRGRADAREPGLRRRGGLPPRPARSRSRGRRDPCRERNGARRSRRRQRPARRRASVQRDDSDVRGCRRRRAHRDARHRRRQSAGGASAPPWGRDRQRLQLRRRRAGPRRGAACARHHGQRGRARAGAPGAHHDVAELVAFLERWRGRPGE
jgi:hypothetical protein